MSKYDGQKIRVVTAEIRKDGRYLITQRLPSSTLPLLWEFPGGRVPGGGTPEETLADLLADKLGAECEVGELVMHVVHEYEHYTVDLQVYRCFVAQEEDVQPVRVQDVRWVLPSEFAQYEFPKADEQTISLLLGLGGTDPGDDDVS